MLEKLDDLLECFSSLGCQTIYALPLSENDNNKQQIYFCSSYEQLSHFVVGEISSHASVKIPNFKAKFPLRWLDDEGNFETATGAQLILYPAYPEIRLSGFVKGCRTVKRDHLLPIPKDLRKFYGQPDGRVLFIGAAPDKYNYAFLSTADSTISSDFSKNVRSYEYVGKQYRIPIKRDGVSEEVLLGELLRIYRLGPIESKKYKDGEICYCNDDPNCPGYTLEVELKVHPNGNPSPDFAGWEVKAKAINSRTTLLTPEPDGGYYKEHRLVSFLRKYGVRTRSGKVGFNGVHKANERQSKTGHTLKISGFDFVHGKINDVNGKIYLEGPSGEISASWSFAKVLEHWQRKHHSTAYVRTTKFRHDGRTSFAYGPEVTLCRQTTFSKFICALNNKFVVYDPGPSMMVDGTKTKARSQFRLSAAKLEILEHLYESIEQRSVLEIV